MHRLALLALTGVVSASPVAEPRQQEGDEPERIRVVRAYRAAVQAGDAERIATLMAPGARIWFGERKGEGRPLNPMGKGPWGEWDRFFRATSTQTDFTVVEGGVRVTNLESNDWHRLVDRTPVPYYVFYFLDDQNRVSGKLIQAIEGLERAPDRLPEFEAWAERRHPGLLDQLMPDGHIDPAQAKLWKEKLLEWRADAGLPNVLPEE